VPDQLIDYGHGRAHTYFDGEDGTVVHIDFTPSHVRQSVALLGASGQGLRRSMAAFTR
jgi:hypothetical protein